MSATRALLAVFVLSLLPAVAWAQVPTATLTGTVVDDETGEPLPGASVFIATSTRGDVVDTEGRFELRGVPVGAHRLYVSIIGFEPVAVDTLLREPRVYTFNFRLKPTVLELEGEVVVEAERDRRWQRRYERFKRLFIGETPNAMYTEILNPEVLDFENNGGEFRAIASGPLIIENRALGYRIQYFLREFGATPTRTFYDGEPLYEELEPEDEVEAQRWDERRRAAFIGSPRHFLLALLAGQVEEQGFLVFSRPVPAGRMSQTGMAGGSPLAGQERFPMEPQSLIEAGETPQERILGFEGVVEIVYRGETEDESYLGWSQQIGRKPRFQTSQMWQERGPTVLDYKGDLLNPYGVTVSSYWAFERVADDVPKEYRPGR